jgi:hypothetical protein
MPFTVETLTNSVLEKTEAPGRDSLNEEESGTRSGNAVERRALVGGGVAAAAGLGPAGRTEPEVVGAAVS